MRKLYKKPNSCSVALDWEYDDYKKSNSFYEYNHYTIKTHMDWLGKLINFVHRNGRKQIQNFIPQPILHNERKLELGKVVKTERKRDDGSIETTYPTVLTDEEKLNNEKSLIEEEGNIRRENYVNRRIQQQKLAIHYYISDYMNWEFQKNMYRRQYLNENVTIGKWYVERVLYRYRSEKTISNKHNNLNWKELIDRQSYSFLCLGELTEYIIGICMNWCNDSTQKGIDKYYTPLKEKYNLPKGLDGLITLSKKLGREYMDYQIRLKEERERKSEWNDVFELLFNETLSKKKWDGEYTKSKYSGRY